MTEEVLEPADFFVLGSYSLCMATMIVQPMDVIKNRMQVSGEGGGAKTYKSSIHAIRRILESEGIYEFLYGVEAGVLRQFLYTGTRIAVYETLYKKIKRTVGRPPSFGERLLIAPIAGSVAAFVSTPAELCLVRMTVDTSLPAAEQRNYFTVFDALSKIAKEEGFTTLWRGCGPTVGRAVLVNTAQLASYSQCKEMLVKKTDDFKEQLVTYVAAGMISTLFTSFVSLPVDMVKTRLQKMKTVNGVPEYKGFVDIISRTVRKEGVFALWKGFTPYCARLGLHSVLTFIFFETLMSYKIEQLKPRSSSK